MSSPVIVALDVESNAEALALVDLLGEKADAYKVGLQMLTADGPTIIRALVARGKMVFLDLKLHEIPNSVSGAVTAAGKLGVSMITVHASGGSSVLAAAVRAAQPFPELKVLALTVITSLTDEDLPEIGLRPSVREQVLRLARVAAATSCHGVVASALEAEYLRAALPGHMLIVTPGIQLPAANAKTDQVRFATPEIAARFGADHVVIGRAITQAADPNHAFGVALNLFLEGRGHRQLHGESLKHAWRGRGLIRTPIRRLTAEPKNPGRASRRR